MAQFPQLRLRRLRRTGTLRDMVRETRLHVSDLVYPLFAVPGQGVRKDISSIPGSLHLSPDLLAREADSVADLGIPAVLLFGLPESKDGTASGAYDEQGVVQTAVREIKRAVPELVVITDPEGTIQYVNPAFEHVTGYSREQATGLSIRADYGWGLDVGSSGFYLNLGEAF